MSDMFDELDLGTGSADKEEINSRSTGQKLQNTEPEQRVSATEGRPLARPQGGRGTGQMWAEQREFNTARFCHGRERMRGRNVKHARQCFEQHVSATKEICNKLAKI